MTIKKEYKVGDRVWIYGVGNNTRPTQGKIVKSFTIDFEGFSNELHYLIAIPTAIDDLLEVRTWHTISQDAEGPVGSLREVANLAETNKAVSRTGYMYDPDFQHSEPDDPSADEIHAALTKSMDSVTHQPLILKEPKPKPKRRQFTKRKPKE